jgi:hypothetical protein
MDDQTKKKIIYIRQLLKKNAPVIYNMFALKKLNKHKENNLTGYGDQDSTDGVSPTGLDGTTLKNEESNSQPAGLTGRG